MSGSIKSFCRWSARSCCSCSCSKICSDCNITNFKKGGNYNNQNQIYKLNSGLNQTKKSTASTSLAPWNYLCLASYLPHLLWVGWRRVDRSWWNDHVPWTCTHTTLHLWLHWVQGSMGRTLGLHTCCAFGWVGWVGGGRKIGAREAEEGCNGRSLFDCCRFL